MPNLCRALILLALFAITAPAATLSSRVTNWKGEPIAEARLTLSIRPAPFDNSGRPTLSTINKAIPIAELTTSANGTFQFSNLSEAIYTLRIEAPGYITYINHLIVLSANTDLLIELASENPTEEECAASEEKRQADQILARAGDADELAVDPPSANALAAAAQPVVPEQVWMQDLNGYTGLMNLDEYISGVVTREMGDSFPFEALKAQAVAARTYALDRHRTRGYANGGQAYSPTPGPKSTTVTINSSGVALTYNNQYITAFFSARCNGDRTLESEDGLSGLATCTVGGLLGGRYVAYLRSVACAGHINCSQTTEQCCVVQADGRTQYIYGHGVGLCQRGAQDFARHQGFDWSEIVHRFYTSVTDLPGNRLKLGDTVEVTTTSNRRPAPCDTSSAVSTPAGSPATVIAGPETVPCTLIAGQSHLTWWRIALANGARGWIIEDFIRKSPTTQAEPTAELNVTQASLSTATLTATANRPFVRMALETTADFITWSPAVTATTDANGQLSLPINTTSPAVRHYRARIILPDTAP